MSIRREPGAGKKQLEIMLKNLDGKVAKVGWLDRSSYYESKITVAEVAAIQEFGAPSKNIPPRPFFRLTIAAKEKEWRRLASSGAKAIALGNATMATVMEGLGLKAAGDTRKTISTLQTPILKKATIAARLRRRADRKTVGNLTKPLVDTGFMLATLSNTVEDE